MSFRLPCLDVSVDTRLSVKKKPTQSDDTPRTQQDDDNCVLTLSSCWHHDDSKFIHSKVQMLEKDTYAVATKLMETESWTNLLKIIKNTREVGCLRVVGCGHQFSGLPLLYAFMATGFKCPICRFGGNAEIDITAPAPSTMCPNVWTTMCLLANVVRKRDLLEKINEERILSGQVSRQAIAVVYQSMPWVILFVLYKESTPTMASTPYAQIPIRMTVDTSNAAHSSGQPGCINLSAGVSHFRTSITLLCIFWGFPVHVFIVCANVPSKRGYFAHSLLVVWKSRLGQLSCACAQD